MLSRILAPALVVLLGASGAYAYFGGPKALLSSGAKPAGKPLAADTYNIVRGANAIDGGGAASPWVAYRPTNSATVTQKWIWNGSTLKNSGIVASAALVFDATRNSTTFATISDAGLTVTAASNGAPDRMVFTSSPQSTGKWVVRINVVNCTVLTSTCAVGIADGGSTQGGTWLGSTSTTFGHYDGGGLWTGGNDIQDIQGYSSGAVIDQVYDFDGKLFWGRVGAGNWNNNSSAVPLSTGGVSIAALTNGPWSPAVNFENTGDKFTIQTPPTISGATPWGSTTGPPGPFMVEASAVPTVDNTGDTWTILSSGSGYTMRNNRTGNYLGLNANNALVMSTTQTVWTFVPVGAVATGITVTPASASLSEPISTNTVLASVSVTMSDGSAFPGTVTTSNTTDFKITGSGPGFSIAANRNFGPSDDNTTVTTTITAVPP